MNNPQDSLLFDGTNQIHFTNSDACITYTTNCIIVVYSLTGKQRNEGYSWVIKGFVRGCGTTNEQKNYEFEDNKLNTGKYSYVLKQID